MASQQQERRAPPRPPPPHSSAAASGTSPSTSQQDQIETGIHTFRDIQTVHDTAYRYIDAGLQADERGDARVAIDSYIQGLQLLNRALRVNCEQLSECTSDQIDQAKEMLMKFNKTKQQITFRLQSLQADQAEASNQQDLMEASAPPSYEEAMSEPSSSPPAYDDDELTALGESLMRRELSSNHLSSGAELYSIPDGVQIFFITPEGYVSAPSYPTSLHIVRLEDEPQTQGPNGESPPAFLHVGDWVYPLIPGASPVLHTNYGAYLFPDVMATEPGSAVGLMVPDSLPVEERQRFEDTIRTFALYGVQSPEPSPTAETQPVPVPRTEAIAAEEAKRKEEEKEEEEQPPTDTAGKIAQGIQTAADWIVWGVGKGAEKAGELIQKGAEKIREKSRPVDQPRKIDPKVQKGVIYARHATNGAVKVTGYIVNKLGEVTVALAREVAPHLRKQGSKIIPKSFTKEGSKGKSKMDGVVEVAASGLKGFGTVYMGLEVAAKSLGRSLANETVHVVKHKYGDEAGTFTENTMYTTGNVFMTAYTANHIGVKAMAKRAAKETGRALIEDMEANRAAKKNQAAGASGASAAADGSEDKKSKTNPDGTQVKYPSDEGPKKQ